LSAGDKCVSNAAAVTQKGIDAIFEK
jgi:hypothetical protein